MHNCLWWRCLQQTSNPQKIRPRYCLDLPLHLHPDLPFCIGLDLNRSGHSFRACVALRLTQLCLLPRFRAPRPRERGWFPPVEARFMCGRSVLRTSTCCSSVSAAPFMLTNSLCACSEDREISTAFCWSSFGSRDSRSFSEVFSVDNNTILYLIMLSGLANSQDRESVRSWVENSSNVWPEVFEWSQNWYPDTALSNLVHIRSKSYPHLRTNLNYRKSFNLQVRASLVPVSIFIRWDVNKASFEDVTTLFLKGS